MGNVAVRSGPIPSFEWASSTLGGSRAITAASHKLAQILMLPRTPSGATTITKVGFRTSAASNPQNIRIGLETLDASGDPSGTQYGGSSPAVQTGIAANTYYRPTLVGAATPVAQDKIAIVAQFDSTVGNVNLTTHGTASPETPRHFGYMDHFVSSWTKLTDGSVFSLEYDNGAYVNIDSAPWSSHSLTSVNSASTPDEYALRFKFAGPVRINKFWWAGVPLTASATVDIVLYDSDGTSVLETVTVDPDQMRALGNFLLVMPFAQEHSLTAATFYRLAVKPTSTNNVRVRLPLFQAAAMLDSMSGGQDFHLSTRTDGGTWSNTLNQRISMGVFLSGLGDGVAATPEFELVLNQYQLNPKIGVVSY